MLLIWTAQHTTIFLEESYVPRSRGTKSLISIPRGCLWDLHHLLAIYCTFQILTHHSRTSDETISFGSVKNIGKKEIYYLKKYLYIITSVDTEMCCPKGKCGCQYFILLTCKKEKNHGHRVLDFFNKKLILDYYFCLKSGPVFLFQILIIVPLPLPRDIKLHH